MIKWIKPEYAGIEPQDDLRDDSILLFTINMTAIFYEYNKRLMNINEIDKYSLLFRDLLRKQNNQLENQTS